MIEARPKALIVEDEAVTRTLVAQLLEGIGCDVDLAVDGEEALAQLTERDYDVVVLDIVLPKMSGIDVMESLRRDKPNALGCIIVVTGLDIREIRTLFPAVHQTLSKPVIPNRLRQAVRTCLRR
ncbi:MAG: two-component system, cell cycle response regulator [Thermoanaerobaculia bacterium]|jgi:CheY-like chemotaxis protein|nr:two-component system, cell cycle response regulator [Thermoanaerobaculia bacterium]